MLFQELLSKKRPDIIRSLNQKKLLYNKIGKKNTSIPLNLDLYMSYETGRKFRKPALMVEKKKQLKFQYQDRTHRAVAAPFSTFKWKN